MKDDMGALFPSKIDVLDMWALFHYNSGSYVSRFNFKPKDKET
jgi:hypothetical protein